MLESQIDQLFEWASHNVEAFEVSPCDESTHYYYKNVKVGAYRGDTMQLVANDNSREFHELLKLKRESI